MSERCVFLTVPDMTVPRSDPARRLIRCTRLASEHPVVGVNRFTNHERIVTRADSKRIAANPSA